MRRILILILSVLFSGVLARSAPAAPPGTVMEEFRIPAADAGITLYLRNKHPAGIETFSSDRILLYVHGATYPAETAFDLPLAGLSWMDYLAAHGYDVYLVDLRGYGLSTRPPEMSQPAEVNPPIVRTETAVRDVSSAVDFILKRRGVPRIDLLGWSWGTSTMGWYAAQNPGKVEKLVLYAPLWLPSGAALADPGKKLGAYRAVTVADAKARWVNGVPEAKRAALIPEGWFEQWAQATFATDPEGARQDPPVLRAPNGVLADRREFWEAGKPLYDPAAITAPTLIVHAEWDADLPSPHSHALFAKLTNARYKRFVEIGEGTHTVLMEKNRMELFEAVQHFLDEQHAEGR
jgi:pimeloyl-ACP methyl ester carboxylesterase